MDHNDKCFFVVSQLTLTWYFKWRQLLNLTEKCWGYQHTAEFRAVEPSCCWCCSGSYPIGQGEGGHRLLQMLGVRPDGQRRASMLKEQCRWGQESKNGGRASTLWKWLKMFWHGEGMKEFIVWLAHENEPRRMCCVDSIHSDVLGHWWCKMMLQRIKNPEATVDIQPDMFPRLISFEYTYLLPPSANKTSCCRVTENQRGSLSVASISFQGFNCGSTHLSYFMDGVI